MAKDDIKGQIFPKLEAKDLNFIGLYVCRCISDSKTVMPSDYTCLQTDRQTDTVFYRNSCAV